MDLKFVPVDFDPFAEEQEIHIQTTEAQRELITNVLFGDDAANCAYNESVSLKLTGRFNYTAFQKSVNALVQRHQSLRSVFSEDATEMIVAPFLFLEVPLIDFSEFEPGVKQLRLNELISEEVTAPFDLNKGPLFDVKVVRFDDALHYVIITGHHVILDGWSTGIAMQELSQFYNAFLNNTAPELNAAHNFSEYALSEYAYEQTDEFKETENFWLSQFETIPAFELYTDKQRPPVRTYRAHRFDSEVSEQTVSALKKTGAANGCSLVNTLIAAFEVFLYKITGNKEVVIGLPAAGQSVTDMYSLIGHCVNLLPLRTAINPDEKFSDYLKTRKSTLMDAFDHQRFTFGTLLKKLNIERDPSRIPLTPVCFNVDLGIADGVVFDGLQVEFISNPRKFENFELFLNATGQGGKLILECTYNTDLFDDAMMQNRISEFVTLLECIVENAETKISKLNILPKNELQMLDAFNNNFSQFSSNKGVHHLFEEQVILHGDKTAIITNDSSITYSELNNKANKLANHLLKTGFKPGAVAAICLNRSIELPIAMLAVLKAGGTYLPIDPEFPKERVSYMLKQSQSFILITQQEIKITGNISFENCLMLNTGWENIFETNNENPALSFDNESIAYILFTSGSTGIPKGVMIPHKALTNCIEAFKNILGTKPDDTLLALTTISFDISELEIYLPLISGAKLFLASKEIGLDAEKIQAVLNKFPITIMQATPVTWQMLFENGWKGKPGLIAICGGESMPSELATYLLKSCKEVYNVYGPTEATIWATYLKLSDDNSSNDSNEKTIGIGTVLPNYITYIVDENMNRVPAGIEGEILIGGIGLSKGYVGNEELTQQKFITDPFDFTGLSKVYRTGDKGRYNLNGSIEFSGRTDQQVKIRGFRIELGEIENAINSYVAVNQSAVVVQQNQNDKRLVAFVVPSESTEESINERWQNEWEFLYEKASETVSAQHVQQRRIDQAVAHLLAPEEEQISAFMNEFNAATIQRIKELKPKRVLEIGCGSGQQLLEIAPICQYYYATDFSKKAIDTLRDKLELLPELQSKVKLAVRPADELADVEENSFDTIILNSVIQYFSGIDYLQDVLQQCLRILSPGGCIYIGDVQSKSLLETLYISQQLRMLNPETTTGQLKQIIQSKLEQTEELMVDPGYFEILKNNSTKIKHIECVARRGELLNYEIRYHYDVILYGAQQRIPDNVIWRDWNREFLDERKLASIIQKKNTDFIFIRNFPNERLLKPTVAAQLLNYAVDSDKIFEVSKQIDEIKQGVLPENLFKLADENDYHLDIFWNDKCTNGISDLAFIKKSKYESGFRANPEITEEVVHNDIYLYANQPAKQSDKANRALIEALRNYLKEKLPAYMIPAGYRVLEKLPLLPNGKINRKLLLEMSVETTTGEKTVIRPRTETEFLIASVWEKLLNQTNMSVTDNFFELGGHSLIAVRLMIEIEKIKGIKLPLAILFTNPTIEQLAKAVDTETSNDVWKPITPIRVNGNRNPVFFAHGVSGNVFKYYALGRLLHEEIPAYGLQAKGLNGIDKPFYSIPEMAEYHIGEILKIQPDGPYYIGGGSFGGYLAFEIAKQLRAMNREVAFLGLFDLEAATKTALLNPMQKTISDFRIKTTRFATRFKSLVNQSPTDQINYIKNKFTNRTVINERKMLDEMLKKQVLEDEYGSESASYFNEVEEACYIAMKNYHLEPYDGKVVLFRAINGFYSIEYDHDLGWGFFAKGGCDVVEVSGDHNSIFEMPNVIDLAKYVQQYIDNSIKK